uniref:Uncharacterized protein n=1 Tax=Setaria italica TaxID=4555 RepID=K3XNH3_SETIT
MSITDSESYVSTQNEERQISSTSITRQLKMCLAHTQLFRNNIRAKFSPTNLGTTDCQQTTVHIRKDKIPVTSCLLYGHLPQQRRMRYVLITTAASEAKLQHMHR